MQYLLIQLPTNAQQMLGFFMRQHWEFYQPGRYHFRYSCLYYAKEVVNFKELMTISW